MQQQLCEAVASQYRGSVSHVVSNLSAPSSQSAPGPPVSSAGRVLFAAEVGTPEVGGVQADAAMAHGFIFSGIFCLPVWSMWLLPGKCSKPNPPLLIGAT